MAAPLAGLRALVTRPAAQADAQCAALRAAGAQVERLPLLAIAPQGEPAAQRALLAAWRDADCWIFTSRNAVDCARALDRGPWPLCLAVGPATAAALEAAGAQVRLPPPGAHDSDGLLALDALQSVAGRRVLLVTGVGGRTRIEDGLRARGARWARAELYRREPQAHPPERLAAALAAVDVAILTSGEALDQLVALTPPAARAQLQALQLVVPSRRVVEHALASGFAAPPLVPDSLDETGIAHCLATWWAGRGRRTDTRMTDDKQDASTPAPAAATPSAPPGGAPGAPGTADPAPAAAPAAAPPDVPPPPAAAPGGRSARSGANGERRGADPGRRPPPAPPPRRSGSGVFGWLFLILLLAALAAAGWEAWRRGSAWVEAREQRLVQLAESLNAAEAQADRLQTRVTDQAMLAQRNAAEIARFGERLEAQDEAVGLLREELDGGRARVQLAVVEELLLLANDRLHVGREVGAALAALEAADARLAALKDPRLFAVREAIARERAALQAVPQADTVGAALMLAGLIGRAERLALAAQLPQHFESRPPAQPPSDPGAGRLARAWTALKRALGSMLSIRRSEGPAPQLLSDAQTALIRQVLVLKLEGARVALLRRDAASFRDLTGSAAGWLDSYYHAGDPAVAAARSELLRLQTLQLEPPLPDITRSLTLLRGQIEPAPQ